MQGHRWLVLSPMLDELLELTGRSRTLRLAEFAASDPGLAEELSGLMALEAAHPDFLAVPVVEAEAFAAQAGQEIGPYRLISPLGEGGMGQVWLAVRADGLYERRVALKLLRPGLSDIGLQARFTRERQILARLGHPCIARLLDAGISHGGQPYLALEYVRGEPITEYVQKRSLGLAAILQLFAQVCAAVSHAHANLVVHRDLKPSNILVSSAGEVCLLDFGIAKLLDQDQKPTAGITRTGSRTFTLHYAAPEQLRGEVITTMTDVYALGMVLYELLADCKPYELTRQSDAAWEEAILGSEPGRPSQVAARKARESGSLQHKRRARLLAGDLDNIVLKALSKEPEQRYASVEALAQDLRRHLDGEPVHARPQNFGYRARRFLRRHAWGLAAGLGASGLLAVALTIVSWQASKAMQEATHAQAMQDAELIGLIATLRSGLGDNAEALDLLDRQQDVFQRINGPVPVNLVLDSAALRGHSLRSLGRNQECLTMLEPMRTQAQASAGDHPLQASEFLSQLGRCHAAVGGEAAAGLLFGQALQLRLAQAGAESLVAESENDLALLVLASGRPSPGPGHRAGPLRLKPSGQQRRATEVGPRAPGRRQAGRI